MSEEQKKPEVRTPEQERDSFIKMSLSLHLLLTTGLQAAQNDDLDTFVRHVMTALVPLGKVAAVFMHNCGVRQCGKCGGKKIELRRGLSDDTFTFGCQECDWSSKAYEPGDNDSNKLYTGE